MKNPFFLLFIIMAFWGCDRHIDTLGEGPYDGLKPIYISKTNYDKIHITDPQPLKEPGKMYKYKSYIFINEKYKGVHIVDNSDPYNPVKIKFISIPGNKDMAMKSGILYADNFNDIIAIDLRDFDNVKVTKRLKNVIPSANLLYPEFASGVYFECVDTNKGFVVGWESVQLTNPKCYKQ